MMAWQVSQVAGAPFAWWQEMQVPMLVSFSSEMTVRFSTGPWHSWQVAPAEVWVLWLKVTNEGTR